MLFTDNIEAQGRTRCSWIKLFVQEGIRMQKGLGQARRLIYVISPQHADNVQHTEKLSVHYQLVSYMQFIQG